MWRRYLPSLRRHRRRRRHRALCASSLRLGTSHTKSRSARRRHSSRSCARGGARASRRRWCACRHRSPRASPSLARCTQGALAAVLLSLACVLLASVHRASTEEGSVSVERRRLAAYGAEPREWRALSLRMRADARRTIFFIHVSKSGGTSFCLTGMENECHDAASAEKDMTARDNIHSVGVDNCWSRQLRDGPKWAFNERAQQRQAAGEHFTHQSSSCARRLEWSDAHQVTLMAVCQQFSNLARPLTHSAQG